MCLDSLFHKNNFAIFIVEKLPASLPIVGQIPTKEAGEGAPFNPLKRKLQKKNLWIKFCERIRYE